MKAKSDYVTDPMTDQGILTLLNGLQKAPGEIAVLCDTYGGAINKIASDATAFVHRGNTKYVMQYYMQWDSAGATNANIAMMRTLYTSMRPFVSGGCYVNYCDLDLGDGYAKGLLGRQPRQTDEDQGRGRSEKYLQACPERAAELRRLRERKPKTKAGLMALPLLDSGCGLISRSSHFRDYPLTRRDTNMSKSKQMTRSEHGQALCSVNGISLNF